MSTTEEWAGSKHIPDSETLKSCIQILKEIAVDELSSGDLISGHNAYTNYVLLQIMAGTSHRPVIDPLCYRNLIDEDSGYCIIEDKVITEKNRYRLSILPTTCCRQILLYEQHLQALATRIYKNKPADWRVLATQINTLGQKTPHKNNIKIPFFFYIDSERPNTTSISESSIEKSLKSYWPYRQNGGRHSFASILRVFDASAELISMQLGHQPIHKHPFGGHSIWSPELMQQKLRPLLDDYMNFYGWAALEGFYEKYNKKLKQNDSIASVHTTKDFGPVKRAINRKKEKDNDIAVIDSILTKERINEFLQNPDGIKECVDSIKLQVGINDERRSVRLRIFWKKLHAICRSNIGLKFPGREFILQDQKSPFNDDSLLNYNNSRNVRNNFISYIECVAKSSTTTSVNKRIAEICVCAALFDGVVDSGYLVNLSKCLPGSLYCLDDYVFVDIPWSGNKAYELPYWRWVPGNLGRALLYGLIKIINNIEGEGKKEIKKKINNEALSDKDQSKMINYSEIKANMKNIISSLDENYKKSHCPVKYLSNTAKSYWLFHNPSYLRELSSGRSIHQPLPSSAIVRLWKDEKIVNKNSITNIETIPSDNYWSPKLSNTPIEYPTKAGDEFQELLNTWITSANNIKIRSNAHKNTQQKAFLSKLLAEEFHKLVEKPDIVVLIVAWCRYLCVNGTVRKKNIAYSTARDYTKLLAKPLVEQCVGLKFINLNESEYEEIYSRIMLYKKGENKKKLRHCIFEFHKFIMEYYGVVSIEESCVLYNDKNNNSPVVNANILTPLEYQHSLLTIQNLSALDEVYRSLLSGLLIIGYRFGLRMGEALGLQYKDFQISKSGEDMIIHVGHNLYRNLKTDAGVRQVPLIGSLTKNEKSTLKTVLERAKTYNVEDKQIGIFSVTPENNILLDRGYATNFLHKIMRDVSGENNIRYHHLRHSWINRCFATVLFSEKEQRRSISLDKSISKLAFDCGRETLIQLLSGHEFFNNRLLLSISLAIGHSSQITTLSSYFHLADAMISRNETANNLFSLSDIAVSYVLNSKFNSIRSKRNRKKISSTNSVLLFDEINYSRLIQYPDVETERYRPVKSNDKTFNTKVRFSDTERILSIIARRHGEISGISDSFIVSPFYVDILKDMAIKLEIKSGYDDYDLSRYMQDFWFSNPVKYKKNVNTTKLKSIRNILNTIEKLFDTFPEEKIREFYKSAETWLECYSVSTVQILISNQEQLKNYLYCLSMLNISYEHLNFYVPKDETNEDSIFDFLPDSVMFIQNNLPLNNSRNRLLQKSRIGVSINCKSDCYIRYQRRLDRVLFVLLIILKIKYKS